MKFFFNALEKYVMGMLFVALLVFWPAGSLQFWNGWLFMGLLFVPMLFAGIVMMIKNPLLLKSRCSIDYILHRHILCYSV